MTRRLTATERRVQAAQAAYDRAPRGMRLIRWVRLRDARTADLKAGRSGERLL